MNWKIERDYFFKELYEQTDQSFIEYAGFFFDSSTENVNLKDTLNILCTPVNFLKEKLSNSKNPAIILSTGAMCPLHDGHIEMMELAKKAVEEKGYDVIGGYLSPDHDEYIFSKVKDKPLPIHHRIDIINKQIKDVDWISVDPFNGVFCKVAVNFTDIIYRLEMYIEKHLGVNVPIFFVCGGDNAKFAGTFTNKGHCVVVRRPGGESIFETMKSINFKNPNIIFAEGMNPNSSTEVRKKFKYVVKPKTLNLRIETDKHCDKLSNIFLEYFESIHYQYVERQKVLFKNLTKDSLVISLDSQIKSKYKLDISRKYDIFGISQLGFTNRPDYVDLDRQISNIPKNYSYVLFDDDIHTGNTVRYVKKLLESNNIYINGFLSFNIAKNENEEILDQRDFFIGGEHNGLMIELPNGEKTRVPYIYPYVDPFIRASINEPLQFSIDIWKLNYEYFKNLPDTLEDHKYLKVFTYIGFDLSTPISDICDWHIKQLENIKL